MAQKPNYTARNYLSVSLPNLVLGASLVSLPREEQAEDSLAEPPSKNELEGLALCDHVDSGWSWVIMVTGTLALFIANGFCYSCGVLYLPLLEAFGEGEVMTSLVGSILLGQGIVSAFIASILCDKLGCRKACALGAVVAAAGLGASFFATSCAFLIVTYSAVAGIFLSLINDQHNTQLFSGAGLVISYQAATISVAHYFHERRPFAMAFIQVGSSLGQVVVAPLTHYFVDEYTWRGAMLLLSAISLHLLVVAALLRPHRTEHFQKQLKNGVLFDFTVLKNVPLLLLTLNVVLLNVVLGLLFFHLPAYAVFSGTSIHKASLLLSLIGFTGLFAKPLFGAAMNHPDVDQCTVYSMSQTLTGVLMTLSPILMADFSGQMIFVLLFAIYTTPYFAGIVAIFLQHVSTKHHGAALGLLQCGGGLGILFGPFIGGTFRINMTPVFNT
ncbi:monocarboxylate transporter 4-like [Lingula anatina]|uniref:Monocarboxylate transporter 4-like n=1 Tax=Lingula anatina TaxID=7574 RepID=A0A1S3IBW8_LINAN|nr:monocarboxylate transporter 4-like [Lingula anatina]|eukprot:XP_013395737.1 monocarboxylate transporter 4-like [Lingula anatina]